jgi:lipid-binding SYLF domain-containing protein
MKLVTKTLYIPMLGILFLAFSACGTMSETGEDLRTDAQQAMNTIQQTQPNIADLFQNSVGYAIFPNAGKGAYIIGGASGNGVVYQNGNMIGYADMKEIDIGLQAGGKAFIEVLFFNTQSALDEFKNGQYELSANASAVILEKGVSKEISFEDGIAVVTMPKAGAMAGISVGGQRFTFTPATQ